MDKVTIYVKSSSGDGQYAVTFYNTPTLHIRCDCKAGEQGMICKHKRGLLMLRRETLAGSGQSENLERVSDWLCASPAILEAEGRLQAIEEAKADIAKAERTAKANLARLMRGAGA